MRYKILATNMTSPFTHHHQQISRAIPLISLIAVTAVTVRLYLAFATHSTAEDFYITLRYAENLANGAGMVYNPDQRVLGTTTPLYTLYLAGVARLGADATLFGKLLNIFADGLTCILLAIFGKAISRPNVGLIAAALVAISPPTITWAISGMETSLVTLATLALFYYAAIRKPIPLAWCGAILILLRIDGILAVAVTFASYGYLESKHDPTGLKCLVKPVMAITTILAPWLIWSMWFYGSPIPTSAIAKLTVYAWLSKGTLPNLAPFAHQMSHSVLHKVMLAGVLPGLVIALRNPLMRPLAIWMCLYYAAMAFSKGFLFGWYYVPASPVYFMCAALGWAWIIQLALGTRLSVQTKSKAGHAVPYGLLAMGIVSMGGVRRQIAHDQAVEDQLRKPIGIALKGILKPGERIMLEPIGYIGYFSGAKILDAVGLVSPEVIPYYHARATNPYLDIMAELKPQWVLLRTGEYFDAVRAKVPPERALTAKYRMVRSWDDPAAPPGSTPAFYLLRRRP